MQDMALAGFVTATAVLVVGGVAGSAIALAYPAAFVVAELCYGAFGVLGSKLVR